MMAIFPPRPKRKPKQTVKTEENMQFLLIKQFGEGKPHHIAQGKVLGEPHHIAQGKVLGEFMINVATIKCKNK